MLFFCTSYSTLFPFLWDNISLKTISFWKYFVISCSLSPYTVSDESYYLGGGQMYMWGKIKSTGDDSMYPKPLMDLRFVPSSYPSYWCLGVCLNLCLETVHLQRIVAIMILTFGKMYSASDYLAAKKLFLSKDIKLHDTPLLT